MKMKTAFAMEHLDLINRLRSKDDLHANLFQRVQGKTKLVSDIPEQIIHNEIRKVPALYHILLQRWKEDRCTPAASKSV